MSQKPQVSGNTPRRFSKTFKIEVATRYLRGEGSYRSLSKELGVGKTQIFSWVHNFAEEINAEPTPVMKTSPSQPKNTSPTAVHSPADELESLRRELEQTRKELAYERMRATAYDRMIEIAENRWNIEIRKKAGAKR